MVRLQRVGRKNDPSFRVVVVEKARSTKTGQILEVVGSYNAKAGDLSLKGERILHWISKGAQPSATVHNFLVDQKLVSGKKINVIAKRILEKKEEAPAAAGAAVAEAPAAEGEAQA